MKLLGRLGDGETSETGGHRGLGDTGDWGECGECGECGEMGGVWRAKYQLIINYSTTLTICFKR
ncbi:hypothetical protein CWATWH8502_4344 [Crocosphaera watsonii WH 8502]|uniref:Uncharacterized protein n=1 Tax=Crocosphaera watsonii WH 8502 TaxID=423474 RepID=T2I839_CROWT|nr:hypothetical protein CWATWH8502_4344 [Crocosphaera watsonii WH 8502]